MRAMKDFTKRYLDILTGELKGLNLTRIQDFDDFYNKQILDSILPVEECSFFQEKLKEHKRVIDIGFGGGFPLLPLAFKYPMFSFYGFEARRKKADAVRMISEKLGLNNVKVYHQRYEEVLFDKSCLITFKAVGAMEDLLKNFHSQKDLYVFFYKGPHMEQQEDFPRLTSQFKLLSNQEILVPGTLQRKFLSFHVPRGTKEKLNKNLVKVSELL